MPGIMAIAIVLCPAVCVCIMVCSGPVFYKLPQHFTLVVAKTI